MLIRTRSRQALCQKNGFTLIELVAVLLIVTVIGGACYWYIKVCVDASSRRTREDEYLHA